MRPPTVTSSNRYPPLHDRAPAGLVAAAAVAGLAAGGLDGLGLDDGGDGGGGAALHVGVELLVSFRCNVSLGDQVAMWLTLREALQAWV